MKQEHPPESPLPDDSSALEFLRRGKAGILERWLKALRQRFPASTPQLVPGPRAPELLDRLIESLPECSRTGAAPPEFLSLAREHGQHRGAISTQTVEQLMAEFRLLRKAVSAALLEVPSSERTRSLTHELLDECVEQAVAGFSDGRMARAREALDKRQQQLTEQQHHLEHQLAELTTIIESAPEAIYVGTFEGITRCNQRALDMLGFASLDELKQDIARLSALIQNRDPDTQELLPPEELPFVKALRGEPAVRDTEVVHLMTGNKRIIRGKAAPIHVDGKIVGAVAVNADITEERRREQELAQALSLRDELLSMASHELRTPLSALLLQLQLMQRTASRRPDHSLSAEELTRSLPQATRLASRLSEMLERLLDLSRIRTDRFGLEITTFDLRALLCDLVSRLLPQALAAGCSLEARACGELFVYADPLRLEQVLTNLITNAIKYGAGKPIEVTLMYREDDAVMEVRDQGIGISEQDQRRIFERFVRATESQRSQSLGLGLYITREIVRAHGGTIEVESQPGQGSMFRVTLPTKRLA